MRIAVEFDAYGETMSEVIEDATRQWRAFTGREEDSLPHDAEINVKTHASREFVGTVFARVKVETRD